jgi:hypothetical protein
VLPCCVPSVLYVCVCDVCVHEVCRPPVSWSVFVCAGVGVLGGVDVGRWRPSVPARRALLISWPFLLIPLTLMVGTVLRRRCALGEHVTNDFVRLVCTPTRVRLTVRASVAFSVFSSILITCSLFPLYPSC